jgi:hypothetical protein
LELQVKIPKKTTMGKVKRHLFPKNDESKRKKMKKAAKNIPANEDACQMDEVLPVDDDADEEPIFGDRVAAIMAKKANKQNSKKDNATAAQSNEAKPPKNEVKGEISSFTDFDFDDRLLKVALLWEIKKSY